MKKVAPLLPARSVNFNDLQAAIAAGDSDELAIAKACGDTANPKTASEKPKTQTTSSAKAEKKG